MRLPLTGSLLLTPFLGRIDAPAVMHVSLADSTPLATMTADTGAFAPGYDAFSRFTVPGMCLAAVNNLILTHTQHQSLAEVRAADRNLFEMGPLADTLPASIVAVARSCAARFSIETLRDDGQLSDLFPVLLMAKQDALAQQVLARRLAIATTSAKRDTIRDSTIAAYLAAHPARVAAAQALAAQVESLGSSSGVRQLYAHEAILDYARKRFDTSLMRTEATRIIALGKAADMATIQYQWAPILYAWERLGEMALLESPDSAQTAMAAAQRDLARFPQCLAFPPGAKFEDMLMCTNFDQQTAMTTRDLLLPFNGAKYQDNPPPPVPAVAWYPQAPAQGLPSLIVYRDARAGENGDLLPFLTDFHNDRGQSSRSYVTIPLWEEKYGHRLSIALISGLRGYAVRSLRLSPQAEMDTVTWYIRDHLQLPVTVGFVQTDSAWQITRDRSWFTTDTSVYHDKYGMPDKDNNLSLTALLYDAQGHLVYLGDFDPLYLDKMISKLVSRSIHPKVKTQ